MRCWTFCWTFVGRAPKGAYSSRGRSGHLLETLFSEPLLRTLLRILFYCKTHSRLPSQNPSQNPSENPFPRTLPRTFSEPYAVLPYDALGAHPILETVFRRCLPFSLQKKYAWKICGKLSKKKLWIFCAVWFALFFAFLCPPHTFSNFLSRNPFCKTNSVSFGEGMTGTNDFASFPGKSYGPGVVKDDLHLASARSFNFPEHSKNRTAQKIKLHKICQQIPA